ncbi:hypothetical protein [Streptomyces sp. NPDC048623]|uniref:recombination directionality factor n=1 Tax=Streptomyces sp. NPDC048623 TaxID=3155761 RepID=UPI0034450C05
MDPVRTCCWAAVRMRTVLSARCLSRADASTAQALCVWWRRRHGPPGFSAMNKKNAVTGKCERTAAVYRRNHITHLPQSSGSDLEPTEDASYAPHASGGRPVGWFRVAGQQGGRPIAVSAWRVTTEDRAVADALGGLLGGVPQLLETDGDQVFAVQTRCDRVRILLEGSRAVSFRMVMRGEGGTLHVCDGNRFLEPAGARGSLCGCPTGLADRKAAAQAGRGPMPEVNICFRLAALPDLGVFCFDSSSWELAAELPELAAALEVAATPALGVLCHELVEFTTRSGIAVSFRRPGVGVDRGFGEDSVQLAA